MNMKSLKFNLPTEVKEVALAVSGGADSMFMTMKTLPFLHKHGVKTHILIVNHELRKNSKSEALWIKKYIEHVLDKQNGNGLKVEILKAKFEEKPSSNIQEIARNARYNALFHYCKQHKIDHLFLAHNLDDQAETIFLRIERGSGLDGICGIAPITVREGINIHRPILEIDRDIIESELKQNNWEWVEDPSNLNSKYRRVKVRNFLRSYDEHTQLIKRFGLLSQNMMRVRDFIEKHVVLEFSKCARINTLCYIEIELNYFLKLHEEIKLRILTDSLNYVNWGYLKQRLKNLSALLQKIEGVSRETSESVFKSATLGGCEIIVKNQKLYMFRELERVEYTQNGALKPEKFDKKFQILPQCYKEAYVVKPLGFEGYCWLKRKIDLPKLVNNKIYQVLPAVYNKQGAIVAVYELYGNWEKYITPLSITLFR